MPHPPADLLILQDRAGLVLRPLARIACIRDETFGRLEAIDDRGNRAHRPGPLATYNRPPFIALDPHTLINPSLVRAANDRLQLPDGTSLAGTLPHPAPPAPRAEPIVPALQTRPSDIIYVRATDGSTALHTCDRVIHTELPAQTVARLVPTLTKAGKGTWINLHHVAAIRPHQKQIQLILDNDETLTMSWGARATLEHALGLPHLYYLEPISDTQRHLYDEGLRDWPVSLYTASADFLRSHFAGDERGLMANLIWQVFRERQAGIENEVFGRDHRAFWYVPMVTAVARAGFLGQVEPIGLDSAPARLAATDIPEFDVLQRGGSDPHYALYEHLLGVMVGDYRLFTYRQLGFEEPRPQLRHVGTTRPDLILLAEKISLERGVQFLADKYGVSTIILGGIPSLVSTEFFVEALRPALRGDAVDVVAYVDFDPGGWIVADGFCAQLERYGIKTRRLSHLVLPSRFSAHELELFAIPLPATTPQVRGKIEDWLRRTGGIGGKGLGIHADQLWPIERVERAFCEETGLG